MTDIRGLLMSPRLVCARDSASNPGSRQRVWPTFARAARVAGSALQSENTSGSLSRDVPSHLLCSSTPPEPANASCCQRAANSQRVASLSRVLPASIRTTSARLRHTLSSSSRVRTQGAPPATSSEECVAMFSSGGPSPTPGSRAMSGHWAGMSDLR